MFDDIIRAGTAPNQRASGVKSKGKPSLVRQGGAERPRPNTRTGDTMADLNAAIKMDRVTKHGSSDNYNNNYESNMFPDEALAFDEVVDNWNSERTRLLSGAGKSNNHQESRAKTATSGSRSRSGQGVGASAGSIYTQSGPNVVLNNSSRNTSTNKHSVKLGTGLGQSNNSASVYKSSAQSGGLFKVKSTEPFGGAQSSPASPSRKDSKDQREAVSRSSNNVTSATAATSAYRRTSPRSRRPSASKDAGSAMTGGYTKPPSISISGEAGMVHSPAYAVAQSVAEENQQTLRSSTAHAMVPGISSSSAAGASVTARPHSQAGVSATKPSGSTNTVSPHSKLRMLTHQTGTGSSAGSGSAFVQKLGSSLHTPSPAPAPSTTAPAAQGVLDMDNELDFVEVDELDESLTTNMSLISIDNATARRNGKSSGDSSAAERPQSRKLYLAKEGVNPNPASSTATTPTATPVRTSPVKAARNASVTKTNSDPKPKSAGPVRKTPTVNGSPALSKKKSVSNALPQEIDRPPSRQVAAFPVHLNEEGEVPVPQTKRSASMSNMLVLPDDPLNRVILSDDDLDLDREDDNANDSEYGDPDMDGDDVELEPGVSMERMSLGTMSPGKTSPVVINEFLCSPRLLHSSYLPKNGSMQSNTNSPSQAGAIMEAALVPNTNTIALNGSGSSSTNKRPPSRQKVAAQHLFHGRKETKGSADAADYGDYDSDEEVVLDPRGGDHERDRVLTAGATGRQRINSTGSGETTGLCNPSGAKPALVAGKGAASANRASTAPEEYLSNYGGGGDYYSSGSGYEPVSSPPFKIEVSYSTKSSKVYDTYNSVDNDDFPDDFQNGTIDVDIEEDFEHFGPKRRHGSPGTGDWANAGSTKTSSDREPLPKTWSSGALNAVPKLSSNAVFGAANRNNVSTTAPLNSSRRGSNSGLVATPPVTSRNTGSTWAMDSSSRVGSAIGRTRNKKEWVSASSQGSAVASPRPMYERSSPEETDMLSPGDDIFDFDDAMMLVSESEFAYMECCCVTLVSCVYLVL